MVDLVLGGRWNYEDSYSEDLSQNRGYVKRTKRSTEHERFDSKNRENPRRK
jgi:hypothetical protein